MSIYIYIHGRGDRTTLKRRLMQIAVFLFFLNHQSYYGEVKEQEDARDEDRVIPPPPPPPPPPRDEAETGRAEVF